ncbi:MAG TPA: ATP-binding cassette domain-containing protein [Ramlibacter sp.]|nr:ATP-binding cassette domain-containing protein [Ramlibacter sp.]
MSFLTLRSVSFAYPGSAPVVQDADLDLPPGTLHCLVGRSGCGKTTLLKLAAGLLAPTAGQVLWRGRAPGDPREVGFVFQTPTLLEWLSVHQNVLLPVSLQRRPTPADVQAAQDLLAQLGLGGFAQRQPRQLSGGQQSRVALARALLLRPPLLLLDEPFAALDAITREEVQRDLLRVCRLHGTTVLFVTHDIAEAVFLGHRVSVMAAGRLVHSVPGVAGGRHDSAAFSSACAEVRQALGLAEEVVA